MSEGRRSFWGFGRKRAAEEPAAPPPPAETKVEAEVEVEDRVAETATPAPEAPPAPQAPPAPAPAAPLPAASEPAAAVPAAAPEAAKGGWFSRLRQGLSRSSNRLGDNVSALFTKKKLDASSLQDLEDILIEADLGVDTAMAITDRLSEGRYAKGIEAEELQEVLAEEVERVLKPLARPLELDGPAPFIVLVVGVNGTGKTTTIGKIAAQESAKGKSIVLAAGDTFRAAAVEQLKIWGERSGARVVAGAPKADAAGLVYEALDAAKGSDLLIIDTAGRLQNKAELMAELEKIVRVIKRRVPDGPHAVLLTLDATTGQNAMNQVDIFRQTVGVTGLVMTKLDGTARGGILVAIANKHALPIHFIGIGEGIDDLAPFDAHDFARAIAGL
ncbi:signal recognition particle-docking protein FtsY [Acuticoccus kandeliae]|uniref:signal recognition particle-docking protein FtsY n=1 Tax=Acuticoccus kandeliae TaxID=2073160 RepID=UPI000D3ECEC4|nr:signal recognition particle-docking protein FtsY [Acuticoccus kandeliae]